MSQAASADITFIIFPLGPFYHIFTQPLLSYFHSDILITFSLSYLIAIIKKRTRKGSGLMSRPASADITFITFSLGPFYDIFTFIAFSFNLFFHILTQPLYHIFTQPLLSHFHSDISITFSLSYLIAFRGCPLPG